MNPISYLAVVSDRPFRWTPRVTALERLLIILRLPPQSSPTNKKIIYAKIENYYFFRFLLSSSPLRSSHFPVSPIPSRIS